MSKNPMALLTAATGAAAAAQPATNPTPVDQAFEALKAYRYGSSRAALLPIDEAVQSCLGTATARGALERRLMAVLQAEVSAVAKEYVCRQLRLLGSAASVPALAPLLHDRNLSTAARSALETLPGPEAVAAMRDSLPQLDGPQKAGVLNSLGRRPEADSVPGLIPLLADPEPQIAGAAAAALGSIGTVEAAHALQKFQLNAPEPIRPVVADACLACAERLSGRGNKTEAQAIYRALAQSPHPPHVRQAAQRGLEATR